ncbi:MAG: hypothetical protein J6R13_05790 [Alistipes sp.]|nr:hypothetical protein [Alistipes sp.]
MQLAQTVNATSVRPTIRQGEPPNQNQLDSETAEFTATLGDKQFNG